MIKKERERETKRKRRERERKRKKGNQISRSLHEIDFIHKTERAIM